jgi:spore germination protein
MAQEAKSKKTSQGNNPKYYLSHAQGLSLIASTIIGVGVLTLPRSTTETAHQYGWVAVLAALVLAMIAVVIIDKLGSRFPEKTIVELCRELFHTRRHPWFGKALVYPLILLYALYWSAVTAIVARTFGEVVVTAVLVNTPLEIIVVTMLFLSFLLACYDSEVVVRVNEVLLFIIVVPVLFFSISAYQNAKLEFIMPLFPTTHQMGILTAILPALFSFLGMEVLMMFNGHIRHSKKMLRYEIYGVLVPGILYLLIVVAGTMSFGYEELSKQAWPTLELVKSVHVPGLILERLEAVFLGVWVAAVFTTCGNWFYCANWSFTQLFGIKKKRWTALVLFIACYFTAMKVAQNIHDLFWYLTYVGYVGVVVTLVFPALLLIVAVVRKIDGRIGQQAKKEEPAHEAS